LYDVCWSQYFVILKSITVYSMKYFQYTSLKKKRSGPASVYSVILASLSSANKTKHFPSTLSSNSIVVSKRLIKLEVKNVIINLKDPKIHSNQEKQVLIVNTTEFVTTRFL